MTAKDIALVHRAQLYDNICRADMSYDDSILMRTRMHTEMYVRTKRQSMHTRCIGGSGDGGNGIRSKLLPHSAASTATHMRTWVRRVSMSSRWLYVGQSEWLHRRTPVITYGSMPF